MKKSIIFISSIVILLLISLIVYMNFFLSEMEYLPVIFISILILIFTLFFLLIFLLKSNQRSEIYKDIVSGEIDEKNNTEKNIYPPEIVAKYKDYIAELETYVKKHKEKGRDLNRIYLTEAGWSEEIVELILDKEFGSEKIME